MVLEQRRHQRFGLQLPVKIVSRANRKHLGETLNLSSIGVLFISDGRLKVGEPIEYMVFFPRATDSEVEICLRCNGQVVRNEAESMFAATLERHEFIRNLPKRQTKSEGP